MKVEIETIDDVLPHIREGSGIFVSRRQEWIVVDYDFMDNKTFETPMDLQCRGIKFDLNGKLIARPFHKFFNLGEKEGPLPPDWSHSHLIADKLDGSMIHPAFLGERLVFMARMGVTEQAEAALTVASDAVLKLCRDWMIKGFTPIFEFTSPDNRVVLKYDETKLTLLAIRHMFSGEYLSEEEVQDIALSYKVPAIRHHGSIDNLDAFVSDTRAMEGIEGYVIVFSNGQRLKIKTEAYSLRHRALGYSHREKNVLEWIVENVVDDVIPLLLPERAEAVLAYQSLVLSSIGRLESEIVDFYEAHRKLKRKDFAMKAKASLNKASVNAAFAMLDGKSARATIIGHLKWAAQRQTRVDKIRPLYGLVWNANMGIEL